MAKGLYTLLDIIGQSTVAPYRKQARATPRVTELIAEHDANIVAG